MAMRRTVARVAFVKYAVVAAGLVAAWLLSGAWILAQGNGSRVTVAFSDPSRLGTVRVSLFNGGVTVRPASGRDVVVTSDAIREVNDQLQGLPPGFRRLGPPSGLSITEENNIMTIGSGRVFDGDDVVVEVPARTNLQLSTVNGDDIVVQGIEGEIEVTAVNGEITLTDVVGTVVAHATNGEVRVTLARITPDKPMAFTSFNGDVDVTLPRNARANLKLRSERGDIYTDFDVQIVQQAAAASVAPPLPPIPPLPPLPPGADLRERERQAEEQARRMRELARQARERARQVDAAIYGTINGGGPEFELRTFNGDVYLRRGK
jgi:hypothetical protein